MTAIIGKREDKAQSIDLFEDIIRKFVADGCDPSGLAQLAEHIAWMRRQSADLSVNCRFETVPELQLTRITLEASFKQIAPFEQRN